MRRLCGEGSRSYLGRSGLVGESPTLRRRSQKSAKAVVAGAARRRAEREGQSRDMSLGGARHQKPGQPGRTAAGGGEAASEAVSDEAPLARHAQTDCGAGELLERALATENMVRAWKRVKADKGSAGVDGRTALETNTSKQRGPGSGRGCSTEATGLIRCAAWAFPSREAGRASWGYRPSWTG